MNLCAQKRAYLLLLMVFVLWGSLYVASQAVLKHVPVFTLAFLRFLIAWIFLSGMLLIRRKASGKTMHKRTKEYKKSVLLIGLGGYAVAVGMQLLGTKLVGSSFASLLHALNPITMTVMAAILLKEPLTKNKILGILLAIFGVYLIVGSGQVKSAIGVVILLCSVVIWSLVSVMTKKGIAGYDALEITRDALGIAVVCNLLFCLLEIVLTRPDISFTTNTVIEILYIGVCCTGLTYILWNQCLVDLPASNCSAFYPIQPVAAAILGSIFLKEQITISFIVGTFCIAVGIIVSLLWPVIAKKQMWRVHNM